MREWGCGTREDVARGSGTRQDIDRVSKGKTTKIKIKDL